MTPYLPTNKNWELRLVSKEWKNTVNFSIQHLDLTPKFLVSWKEIDRLMNSEIPVRISEWLMFFKGNVWYPDDPRWKITTPVKDLWNSSSLKTACTTFPLDMQ